MRTSPASVEYMLRTSDDGLESFQLARLGRSANLRKELVQVVTEMIGSEVEGRLAGWLVGRRRLSGEGAKCPVDLAQAIRESRSRPAMFAELAGAETRVIGLLPEPGGIREEAGCTLAALPTNASSGGEHPFPAAQLDLVFHPVAERIEIPSAICAAIPPAREARTASASSFASARGFELAVPPEEESGRALCCVEADSEAVAAAAPRPCGTALIRLSRLSRYSLAASIQPPLRVGDGGFAAICGARRKLRRSGLRTSPPARRKKSIARERSDVVLFLGFWQMGGLPAPANAADRSKFLALARKYDTASQRAWGRSQRNARATKSFFRQWGDARPFSVNRFHICAVPSLRFAAKQTHPLARASPDERSRCPQLAFPRCSGLRREWSPPLFHPRIGTASGRRYGQPR